MLEHCTLLQVCKYFLNLMTQTYIIEGYGDITPSTVSGRVFTMFYAVVGIPLVITILNDWGTMLFHLVQSSFLSFNHGAKKSIIFEKIEITILRVFKVKVAINSSFYVCYDVPALLWKNIFRQNSVSVYRGGVLTIKIQNGNEQNSKRRRRPSKTGVDYH